MARRIDFGLASALVACFVLVSTALACHGERGSRGQSSSDAAAAAKSFYVWYLDELVHNREPYLQDRARLAQLVTPGLLAALDKKSNSDDGVDADYFLRAQDYFDEWIGNVSAVPLHGDNTRADVRISLGKAHTPGEHVLQVRMRSDGPAWRVDQVGAESPAR